MTKGGCMRDWDPFICKDCGMAFHDAADYTDHFVRLEGKNGEPTLTIVGCSAPKALKVATPAEHTDA